MGISNELFYCKGKDANASGNLTEEGFVIYKGSISNLEEVPSAGSWLINTRKNLQLSGSLAMEGNILKFTRDVTFNSPSTAAGVVLGRRSNGWTDWKDNIGRTLDEVKRQTEN